MNAWYAALVTGTVSIQNGPVSRVCAGRSLSSDHGSAEVPIVNGPPGTRASGAGGAAPCGGSGSGAVSTGPPRRS